MESYGIGCKVYDKKKRSLTGDQVIRDYISTKTMITIDSIFLDDELTKEFR